ncbi:MAG: hypothetical protein KGI49_00820 [Patescibacteria group bacterium]|nr:hypothetical protein [Patescibacteria group bacterium]
MIRLALVTIEIEISTNGGIMPRECTDPDGKTIKCNLTLRQRVVNRLREEAKARGMSMSELVNIKASQEVGDLVVIIQSREHMTLQTTLDFIRQLNERFNVQVFGHMKFNSDRSCQSFKIILNDMPTVQADDKTK